MMAAGNDDDDLYSVSTAESDFLSPFAPLRSAFQAKVESEEKQQHVSGVDSWADDDDDEEHNFVTAPYRKALHDSFENSFVTERSSLLTRDSKKGASSPDPRSQIHPLWEDGKDSLPTSRGAKPSSVTTTTTWHWGNFVCAVSGILLACMALHDAYLWYLSYRLGYQLQTSTAWLLPWMSPSSTTLDQFGAFVPYKILYNGQYWRFFTSCMTCTSLAEWGLVCWSWRALYSGTVASSQKNNNKQHQPQTRTWWWLYLFSVLTGQLWMTAWASTMSGIAGGATWGTCGVLCATGVAKPRQRFVLYLTSLALVVLDLIAPYNSVMGGIGASLFGWACYGVGLTILERRVSNREDQKHGGSFNPPEGAFRWWSGVFLLALWVVPTLWIAFLKGR